MNNKVDYLALVEKANYHSNVYYNHDSNEISDQDYDHIFQEIKKIEIENPNFIVPHSPTQKVGGIVSSDFDSVKHKVPMLSLDNSFNEEDNAIFFSKKVSDKEELVGELKMDGLAISLIYEYNVLTMALTRGTGTVGEDVTHTVRTLKSVPAQIISDTVFPRLEVRGEVVMPHAEFQKLNENAIYNGTKVYKNPRNAASGSVRQLNPAVAASRNLKFIPYLLIESNETIDLGLDTYMKSLDFLKSIGFIKNEHALILQSYTDIENYYESKFKNKDDFGFDIDGLVIKVNQNKTQKKLGFSGRAPRWAVARKFPEVGFDTVLNNLVLTVGRSGAIVPNASLETTLYCGTDISNATLHNFDHIQSKLGGLAIGDVVHVIKGGAIIPVVESVVKRSGNRPIEAPTECPACGGVVAKDIDKAAVYCTESLTCPAQAVETIINFACKKKMNIPGLGDSLISNLYSEGLIKTYLDLYTLTTDDLIKLDKVGLKKATTTILAIENSKKTTLNRFISGLGIREVGETASREIANKLKSMDAFVSASYSELILINDVGDVTAQHIIDFFASEDNAQLVQDLLAHGFEFEAIAEVSESALLNGQTWVVTGSLDNYDKVSIKEKLISLGAKVSGSVSKKTTAVLFGDKAGSKLTTAQNLKENGSGIIIVNEEEFEIMISE